VSLVRPILEYGASCWDPYREGQINALERVQKQAAKFVHHKISPNWESLASRRKVSRLCALYKAYCGERAWKNIGDRLKRPHYLRSRADHDHEAKDEYRKIFLCERDHRGLEPVTCRSVRNSALYRLRKVMTEWHQRTPK
jgi:hypothetical protein